jgi:TonB family protein
MNPDFSPISVTSFLSLTLHASVFVAVMQIPDVIQATGDGIDIELVSSSYVSDQRETEQASRKAEASLQQAKTTEAPKSTESNTANKARPVKEPLLETAVLSNELSSELESADNGKGEQALTRSTNASLHNSSIIELLHARISEYKQYPYMARRQRREGTARVEFVLHPDGTIDGARLVNSSRTHTLDKAALEAVKGIEPFKPAKDYLHQPEAFQVDVVFNVL